MDSPHRSKLLDRSMGLTLKLNADCDLLVVDSHSPLCDGVDRLIPEKYGPFLSHRMGMNGPKMLHSFPDNVGHLSRKGRDGWGRAFCYGIDAAVRGNYEYCVHIEGDSLFRLPVMPIIRHMHEKDIKAASTKVTGLRFDMPGWCETGLMFFNCQHMKRINFTAQYNWPTRTERPTPEIVVARLLGNDLRYMPWKTLRNDKRQITLENVESLNLDWITHLWENDPDCKIYDRYLELIQ